MIKPRNLLASVKSVENNSQAKYFTLKGTFTFRNELIKKYCSN